MPDPYVKERDRSRIPERFQWDLSPVYAGDDTWEAAKRKMRAELPSIASWAGKLAESPEQLLGCLEHHSLLHKELTRLACYAGMKSDLDTRESRYTAMDQEMSRLASDFSTLASFIEPEILRMDPARIEEFLAREPRLGAYRHVLDDIVRNRPHTLGESEEKILATAGLMADAPATINSIFTNADFPYPEITLEEGTVRLDPAAFNLHRRSRDRESRKKVFAAYLGKMHEFRRTFGAQLAAEVRKNMFFSRTRSFGSCLERALNRHNIPVAVYRNLIAGVRAHHRTFYRYLDLRRRLLGLDTLHYYDLYAPIVADLDLDYTYDEAAALVLESLAPLGPEYAQVARRALSERWIDVYPNDGKRSGAYSNGSVYDVHPYILLNFNGKHDDVSTLAHELGHTMHSYLANQAQPYALSHYSIFVAEVASTFNEALLLNSMLERETRDEVRLSLLGNYLDNARATVFRQTQFAEFELRIHELAEGGEALTGDTLGELYAAIVREYYGQEVGACVVDDDVKAEWAYVPHFYYNFYVYQYATSFIASTALSERVLAGEEGAVESYLELLAAGGSDYPIPLMARAGVDMTSSEPLKAMMARLGRVMDEIEEIALRLGKLK